MLSFYLINFTRFFNLTATALGSTKVAHTWDYAVSPPFKGKSIKPQCSACPGKWPHNSPQHSTAGM